jgi:hypothetical protein
MTGTATAEKLTEMATQGWKLVQVLSTYDFLPVTMRVLLSKTEPDNLSGLMIDVDKPKPKPRGRPRKDAA